MRQTWLLHNLETQPVSQHWDSIDAPLLSAQRGEIFSPHGQDAMLFELGNSSQSWTRLEMDTLVTLYSEQPLWSYWDIAIKLMHLDLVRSSAFELIVAPWSPEDCACRLHELYALALETFGTALAPLALNLSNAVHTSGELQIDHIVTDLQRTLCSECTALDLGQTHMEAMLDFGDWWTGPDTEGHPASRSIRALEESAKCCPCCNFMYKATGQTSHMSPLMRPAFRDFGTKLSVTRAQGEHYLVLTAGTTPGQKIAQLRMAHCKVARYHS